MIETIGWSWSKARVLRAGKIGAVIGMALMVPLSYFILLHGTEFDVSESTAINVVVVIFGGLLYGALPGAILGALYSASVGGLRISEVTHRTVPNQGIKRSAQVAALSTLIIGLLVALMSGLAFGTSIAVPILAIFFAVLAGLYLGGLATLKHITLRIILWVSRQAPHNLANFLDYASERILLRKVGGGYIFLHRMLLDYFASMDDEDESRAAAARLSDGSADSDVDDLLSDMAQQGEIEA